MHEDGDRRGPDVLRWPARPLPPDGARPAVRSGWLARSERIAALVDAMSWPGGAEAARLDGSLRLAAAPVLADLVTDLARLKALFAGLVAADGRPAVLAREAGGGELEAGGGLDRFRPGRFVALSAPSADPAFAATDPFAALAKRVHELLLPEMEQALAELTVLLHEYLWNQQFELTELVEQLPADLLAALEGTCPRWNEGAEERRAELSRRAAHLERAIDGRRELDDAVADLRRALVRAVSLAGGSDGGESAGARPEAAAEAAAGRLRELLAALEAPAAAGPARTPGSEGPSSR